MDSFSKGKIKIDFSFVFAEKRLNESEREKASATSMPLKSNDYYIVFVMQS